MKRIRKSTVRGSRRKVALGALRFVTGALDPEAPLLQGGLAPLEPLGGGDGRPPYTADRHPRQ
jgi:hypothetical protein